ALAGRRSPSDWISCSESRMDPVGSHSRQSPCPARPRGRGGSRSRAARRPLRRRFAMIEPTIPPGHELDTCISDALGLEPARVAIATCDGGQSAAVVQNPEHGPFYTRQDVEDWVRDFGDVNG